MWGWRHGSSGRIPAYQAPGPEFKPQDKKKCCKRKKFLKMQNPVL
jgi:hypothetical protein